MRFECHWNFLRLRWFADGKMIQVGRVAASGVDTSTTCCNTQSAFNPGGTNIGQGATVSPTSPTTADCSDSVTVLQQTCCIGSQSGTLGGGWTTVNFHVPFPDDEVAVFTQVQT